MIEYTSYSLRLYNNGIVIVKNNRKKTFTVVSNHYINLYDCLNWQEVNKKVELFTTKEYSKPFQNK
jgi:hypothetical protein